MDEFITLVFRFVVPLGYKMFFFIKHLIYDPNAVKDLADGTLAVIVGGLVSFLIFIIFMLWKLMKLWSFVFSTIWFCGWGMACLIVFFCAGSDSNHCPQPWFGLFWFPFALLERLLGGYGGSGGLVNC
ncbi:hypothetical protein PG984_000728 [Apiospora sp. TS-2023a]